jgi:hypothetical protein
MTHLRTKVIIFPGLFPSFASNKWPAAGILVAFFFPHLNRHPDLAVVAPSLCFIDHNSIPLDFFLRRCSLFDFI